MRIIVLTSLLALTLLPLKAFEDPTPQDLLAPSAGATKAPNGLACQVLRAGNGSEHPKADSLVLLHFSGWTQDGKRFAHSERKAPPPHVLMANLMPGMREALLGMVAGELRRIWVPEPLAFNGAKGKPAGAVVMDLDLIEVQDHPNNAPADVACVPGDALLTKSGLAYKVLRPGTGTECPKRYDLVEVHYNGWTTDGKLFDSSLLRRETASFRVNEVVPGFSEGLQQMVVGERRRFWIPEKLAYKGAHGQPRGMLVFDVELLSFTK